MTSDLLAGPGPSFDSHTTTLLSTLSSVQDGYWLQTGGLTIVGAKSPDVKNVNNEVAIKSAWNINYPDLLIRLEFTQRGNTRDF